MIERTIRLLKKNGIKDIAISTNNPEFNYLEVPILKHNNSYVTRAYNDFDGCWCDAFYLTNEPTCYIFGDVYFSEEAIKTIIETRTEDIELFGSAPPFSSNYCKEWIEPFALKVKNTEHLKQAIEKTKELDKQNKFWRKPIMWELWTVIKNIPLQKRADEYEYNYKIINDYTVDVDDINDIRKIENIIKIMKGGIKMIKVEAIENFSLSRYNELKNIQRKGRNEKGKLFTEDRFECTQELADYLMGNNQFKRPFVKIVEVIPEIKKEAEKEEKKVEPAKKTTRKRSTSKSIAKED